MALASWVAIGSGERAGHRGPGGQVDDGLGAGDDVVEQGGVEDGPLDQIDPVDPGQVVAAARSTGRRATTISSTPGVAPGPAEVGADEAGPAGDERPCQHVALRAARRRPVQSVAGVEHVAGVSLDQVVVEGVVVGHEHHGVGGGQLVGASASTSGKARRVVRQVGVGDPDLGAEGGQRPGDDRARRLAGVAGVALVGQAEEEDPGPVDRTVPSG